MNNRTPNFKNLELVLDCKVPSRPTLFEFYMNDSLYSFLTKNFISTGKQYDDMRRIIHAFKNAGYDYATLHASYDFHFPVEVRDSQKSLSLNEGTIIQDRQTFDKARKLFLNPAECNYDHLENLKNDLPNGMKIIVDGPGGVLENVINIFGFDNLCYLIYDDEQLVYDVFEIVGSSLVKYYEIAGRYKTVGAIISNDDWGYKTQTMLSVSQMHKFVFPWHKKIVETIHSSGRQAILHSCGYYHDVIDYIINDIKYDARHSYEDTIVPVEKAYEELVGKIAVLGGIDMNFIATATPEDIYKRSKAIIEQSSERGGYALGTGNSVPEYVPRDNYLAMIKAVGVNII